MIAPPRHLVTPLSIRLRDEKEKRLDFVAMQSTLRCRIENCINWSVGDNFVGTTSMHRDIKVDELGMCWTHVQDQRVRRKEQRRTRHDGKVSPAREILSFSSSLSQSNSSGSKRTYQERMNHFRSNYASSDFSSTTGLGLMVHSAIHLKDNEDAFTFLLRLKTSAGKSLERSVVSACTTIRNPKGFLPLQSAVDTRLPEARVWQLYRRAPAAALDTAMEGLVAGLWAIEKVNEYSTLLVRALLSQVPKRWLREMLKRQRSSYGTFIHRFVTHPSSQLSTLNLLIIYATKACRWRDATGQIPLHAACIDGGAPTIIDGLVQLDRDSVRMIDKRGWPPLFSLVSSLKEAAFDDQEGKGGRYTRGEIEMMMNALITAHSPTLTHITHEGETILHIMIQYSAPNWLLERTMNECPGLVASRDLCGKNVLHLVCDGQLPRDIDQILRLHPRAPEEFDTNGRTPLWALLMNESCYGPAWRTRTVLSILEVCPNAATHTNALLFGQSPLHYCFYYGKMKLARVLVKKHPDQQGGLDVEDVRGELPLHALLARKGNFVDVTVNDVKWICMTYPNGPSIKTRKGHLPLHYAQQKRVPEFVKEWLLACHVGDSIGVQATQTRTLKRGIQLLTEHFPERATNRDGKGNLPLHYALKGDCDPSVVKELIILNPSTVHEVDAHGMPPMHLVATCGKNRHALEHLKIIHQTSLTAHETLAYNKNVLHYACEHCQPLAVIRWLLDVDQWQTQKRDNLGRSPAHFAYDNDQHEVTKLLLSVYADLDDLLLRMDMELLRDALRSRGCVFTVDTVGGNILHRLASNSNSTHVLRAISWYQPWLCRQQNNRGMTPCDVALANGTNATRRPLEQAVRMRLPPSEGGEFHGNLSPSLKHQPHESEEIRSGSRLRASDIFTDSDGDNEDDEDCDDDDGGILSQMSPDNAIRSILEIFWVTMGKQPNGIIEKLNACRTRQDLTTFHLICDTLGRIRTCLPEFCNVPLLPILIPIRWMSEGFGSIENDDEVRASTMAVLRKAVGYKELALGTSSFVLFRFTFTVYIITILIML
jgi:ankyrin repeat protein